jgi:small subunit ribosomal protein S17
MAENTQSPRTERKHVVGIVTGLSGNKTVKVTCSYKIPHPIYKKEIRRKTVLHAHDEENTCKLGDKVELMESRPLSKLKRWRVVNVVEAAPIAAA